MTGTRSLLAFLCVCAMSVVGQYSLTAVATAGRTTDAVQAERLVAVTEDNAEGAAGCDAVTVFDPDADRRFPGSKHISPGRLAASSGMTLFLATQSNFEQFVYAAHLSHDAGLRAGKITGIDSATFGGIAIDDARGQFLVATARMDRSDPTRRGRNRPPYGVARYNLPRSVSESMRPGPALAQHRLDSVAAEILLGTRNVAHVVTTAGVVHTLNLESLDEVEAPVAWPGVDGVSNRTHGVPTNYIQAALSSDGRHLFINRGAKPEITVIDLVARTAHRAPVSPDLSVTGGLAARSTETGADLLAVHGLERVVVFEFTPPANLTEVARAPVPPVTGYGSPAWDAQGPHLSLAWFGNDGRLLAAISEADAEFRVLRLDDGQLTKLADLAACSEANNSPNDIVAAPAVPLPPRRTPTSPTRPTEVPPSPTPGVGPSVLPSPSVESTPTSGHNETWFRLYLPVCTNDDHSLQPEPQARRLRRNGRGHQLRRHGRGPEADTPTVEVLR